eukprot:248778-Amphidinium_carterae.1
MVVTVTKITEAVRNADGAQDQFFGYEFHQFLERLGVRDSPTHANVELLAKQSTLGTKDKDRPSALAADADDRRKLSEMTCNTPAKGKGCRNCGSLKHRSNECEYGKQLGKDKDKDKRKSAKPKANEA